MNVLPPELRAIIVCPKCGGALQDEDKAFRCDSCRLRYPVRKSIPVLLIAQAEPIDTSTR